MVLRECPDRGLFVQLVRLQFMCFFHLYKHWPFVRLEPERQLRRNSSGMDNTNDGDTALVPSDTGPRHHLLITVGSLLKA